MSDALLNAIQTRKLDRVASLLAAGADPNEADKSRYRDCQEYPLHAAIGELEAFGEDEPAGPIDAVILLLLLCGATKSIDEWGGERAMTALGLAARGLHVEMVKLLLAHGADPQGRDVDRFGPLDCLRFVDSPEDPAIQDRLQEIRRLLGATDPKATTSDRNGKEE